MPNNVRVIVRDDAGTISNSGNIVPLWFAKQFLFTISSIITMSKGNMFINLKKSNPQVFAYKYSSRKNPLLA